MRHMKAYLDKGFYAAIERIGRSMKRLSEPFEGLERLMEQVNSLDVLKKGAGDTVMPTYAMTAITKGAEAAVTGGTRNTTVNINLGKMVENIVFNGTLGENAQDLENKIQEILTRTLMMAAATA